MVSLLYRKVERLFRRIPIYVADWRSELRTIGADSVLRVVSGVAGIAIARALLPAGKGAYTALILWVNVYNVVFGVGVNQSAIYHAGRAKSSENVGPVATGIGLVGVAQGALLTIAGLLSVDLLFQEYGSNVKNLASVLFIWGGVRRAISYSLPILQGVGAFEGWNRLRIIRDGLYALLVITFWWLDLLTIDLAILAFVLGQTVAFLWGWLLVTSRVDDWTLNLKIIRSIVRYGYKAYLSDVSQRAGRQLDQIVISTTLGASSLGLYRVARSMGAFATVIPTAVSRILVSKVARSGEIERGRESTNTLWVVAVGMIPILTIGVMVTPTVVSLVYGSEYASAIPPAQLLVGGALVFGIHELGGASVRGRGKPEQEAMAAGVRLVATAICIVPALKLAGLVGGAVSLIVGAMASSGLLIYYLLSDNSNNSTRLGS